MADAENDLMTAFVRIRADISELPKELDQAQRVAAERLRKPFAVQVSADGVERVGTAAEASAAKLRAMSNVDVSRTVRGIDDVSRALMHMGDAASRAEHVVGRVGSADMSPAIASIDKMTARIEQLAAATRGARHDLDNLGSHVATGGEGNVGGRAPRSGARSRGHVLMFPPLPARPQPQAPPQPPQPTETMRRPAFATPLLLPPEPSSPPADIQRQPAFASPDLLRRPAFAPQVLLPPPTTPDQPPIEPPQRPLFSPRVASRQSPVLPDVTPRAGQGGGLIQHPTLFRQPMQPVQPPFQARPVQPPLGVRTVPPQAAAPPPMPPPWWGDPVQTPMPQGGVRMPGFAGAAAFGNRFAVGGAMGGLGTRMLGGGAGTSLGAGLGGGLGNAVGGAIAGPVGGRVLGATLGTAGAMGGKVLQDGLAGMADEKHFTRMFSVLLKDAEQAKRLFSEIAALDLEVPIDLPNLMHATQQLAQAGMEASEIPDKMRVILDAASSSTMGVHDGTQMIVEMVARMKNQGQIMGRELLQLTRMGLPVVEIIQQNFGMTIQQIAKATRDGTIEVQRVLDGLFEGLESRFAGNVSIEIDTFAGQIELLKSKYNAFAGEIARPIFDPLLDALKQFNEYMSSTDVQSFVDGLTKITAEATETLTALLGISEQWEELARRGASRGDDEGGGIVSTVADGLVTTAKKTTGISAIADFLGIEGPSDAMEIARGAKVLVAEDRAGTRIGNPPAPGNEEFRQSFLERTANLRPELLEREKEIQAEIAKREAVLADPLSRFAMRFMPGVQSGIEDNIKAGREKLDVVARIREESSRANQLRSGLGAAGGAVGDIVSDTARKLRKTGRLIGIPDAIEAINEATGLEPDETRKKLMGITLPSLADMDDVVQQAKRNEEIAQNKESVKRREERERQEEQEAIRGEAKAAEKRAGKIIDTAMGGLGGELFDGIDDPRMREMAQQSKFGIRMVRDEDGEMKPTVELQEAFRSARGATQTAGIGGLNQLMQGNVDAANDRKVQEDQKKLLENMVKHLQSLVDAANREDAAGEPAVIAAG